MFVLLKYNFKYSKVGRKGSKYKNNSFLLLFLLIYNEVCVQSRRKFDGFHMVKPKIKPKNCTIFTCPVSLT